MTICFHADVTSYREILSQTLRDRVDANPGYSLRSYARDLALSPAALSEILRARKGMSPKRSAEVAERLRLPEWQRQYFCDLVARDHAKSPAARAAAAKRLEGRRRENKVSLMNQAATRALTSWVDLAILELTHLSSFRASTAWIAKKLGVTEAQARDSVARLKAARLLRVENGKWIDASPLASTTDGVPSEAIRNFHQTVLQKAQRKLSEPIEARTVKTVVFSLSEANRQRARKVLDDAIAGIMALADEAQDREHVLCFSAQLFSLTEETPNA